MSVLILAWSIANIPQPLSAKTKGYPQGDGKIRLYNYHLDEFLEIDFRENGKLSPQALAKIQKLLRSRDNSEITEIDVRLLDLIDHLQDHFGADTVEIISGYRRKKFNEELLKNGHQVSPRSLHTKGMAFDIHIDEIREETLRDYLQGLKLGGVGYYGTLDFIHVDTGETRTWGGSEPFARKLIGVIAPEAPVQLTSDKNDYLPQDSLHFTWKFEKGYGPEKIREVQLEHFWRGQWIPCAVEPPQPRPFGLPSSDLSCPAKPEVKPFGKYRWTFAVKGYPKRVSSNEFYLKKK